MSAEIVNLRRARKDKARAEKAKTAAENRAAFGVARADREAGERSRELAERRHDGHRLLSGSKDTPGAAARDATGCDADAS